MMNETFNRRAGGNPHPLPTVIKLSGSPCRGFLISPKSKFSALNSLSDRREEMGSKKVTLKSSDGGVFEVEEAAALASQVIKNMIEDDCANGGIPLPNVTSKILSKVIEYCKKHVQMQNPGEDSKPLDEDLKCWDADFVKVDLPTLVYLGRAADYLNIRSLLDLTDQTMVDMMKGKTLKEARKAFNFGGTDFSPEEEEEVTLKEKMGSKKVTLKSWDDQVFEVEAAVALESKTIKHMIENDCPNGVIPLENVTSEILSKVIEYCKKHVEMQKPGEDEDSDDSAWYDWNWEKRGDWVEWCLKRWDAAFIKVNRTALMDLLEAADYLKIGSLMDLTFKAGGDFINMVEEKEEERRVRDIIYF